MQRNFQMFTELPTSSLANNQSERSDTSRLSNYALEPENPINAEDPSSAANLESWMSKLPSIDSTDVYEAQQKGEESS